MAVSFYFYPIESQLQYFFEHSFDFDQD